MEENRNTTAPSDEMIEAVKLLVSYLKKHDFRLTGMEWDKTLLSLGAQQEQLPNLTRLAEEADIIIMEEADPDREKFTLPILLNALLQAKIDGVWMSEQDLAVLCYRFGLDDDRTHTLEETAMKFGIVRNGSGSSKTGSYGGQEQDAPRRSVIFTADIRGFRNY